jgi:hypothetical protein
LRRSLHRCPCWRPLSSPSASSDAMSASPAPLHASARFLRPSPQHPRQFVGQVRAMSTDPRSHDEEPPPETDSPRCQNNGDDCPNGSDDCQKDSGGCLRGSEGCQNRSAGHPAFDGASWSGGAPGFGTPSAPPGLSLDEQLAWWKDFYTPPSQLRAQADPPERPSLPGRVLAEDDGQRERRRSQRRVTVRLDWSQYGELQRAAELYGVRPTTLARMLINRGVAAILTEYRRDEMGFGRRHDPDGAGAS